jgi:hypothetical protein
MPFDSQPLVELAGVGKSFGALRALTGIDLRFVMAPSSQKLEPPGNPERVS